MKKTLKNQKHQDEKAALFLKRKKTAFGKRDHQFCQNEFIWSMSYPET